VKFRFFVSAPDAQPIRLAGHIAKIGDWFEGIELGGGWVLAFLGAGVDHGLSWQLRHRRR